jgi:hypothetical protein
MAGSEARQQPNMDDDESNTGGNSTQPASRARARRGKGRGTVSRGALPTYRLPLDADAGWARLLRPANCGHSGRQQNVNSRLYGRCFGARAMKDADLEEQCTRCGNRRTSQAGNAARTQQSMTMTRVEQRR